MNKINHCFKTTSLIIGIFVFFQPFLLGTFGQTQKTTLTVKVTDSAGEALPNATVVIENIVTKRKFTEVTNDAGEAEFKVIQPGNYKVVVNRSGFKTDTRDKQVTLGSASTVEIILSEIFGVTDITSVDAISEAKEKERDLSLFPNFNNDFTPVLQNTVGAVVVNPGALGQVALGGRGGDANTVRIDGLDSTLQIKLPSADGSLNVTSIFGRQGVSLEKASPIKGAFDSFFGPGTGTVIEGQTYSGRSFNKSLNKDESEDKGLVHKDYDWSLQLYNELRNSALNARNFFSYQGKNDIQRNRFGVKFGGFIDDSSIYIAYEGDRGRTERSIFEAVPLEAICQCNVTGPIASFLDSYLPEGTVILPNASQNDEFAVATRRGRTSVKANAGSIRFDRAFSSSALSLRYTPQYATAYVPVGITGRRQKQKLSFDNFLATFDFLIKDDLGGTLRFGFNRTKVQVSSENPFSIAPELANSLVSLSGIVKTNGIAGVSNAPVAKIGALLSGGGRGFNLDPKTISFGYDGVFSLNPETSILFGLESKSVRLDFDRLGGINYSFSNLDAFRLSSPTSTTFLSDLSGRSPFNDLTGERFAKQYQFLSYFQLRSVFFKKISEGETRTESLTFTTGLRYDYFGSVKERRDRAFIIDPETGDILSPNSSFFNAQVNNLQPRFGLTYFIKKTTPGKFLGSTKLKFGAGIYSGVPRLGDLLLPIESDRLNTGISGGDFTIGIDDIIDDFRDQPRIRQFRPLAFSRNFKIPEKVVKLDASVTQTLKFLYDLTFRYAGNIGQNLPVARVGNKIVSVSTNPNPTEAAIVRREFDISDKGQLFRPFGEFFYRSSEGRSNYNSLAISFGRNSEEDKDKTNKSWTRYLGKFSVGYTYSLNKGNTTGAIVSDTLNLDGDYGFDSLDVRHSSALSTSYKFWEIFGKNKSNLLFGWAFTPILKARSGRPLIIRLKRPNVVYQDGSGNIFSSPAVGRTAILNLPGGGASSSTQVPNILPNVNPYNNTDRLTLLNPEAFAIPEPGTFGNLQRGQLRGPSSVSFDFTLSRVLFDNGRFGSELNMTVINALNTPAFANPTSALPNALGTDSENNQIQPGDSFNNDSAGKFGKITAAGLGRQVYFTFVLRIK